MSDKGQPKDKRLSGEMRNTHLTKHAFLIEFAAPSEPRDMFGVDPPLGVVPQPIFAGKDRQAAVDKYRTMERKGFRVTRDIGCLIPDDQYSTIQQGATHKGHQRSFNFFAGWYPKKSDLGLRNMYGWPADVEISHLCHRRSCSRIDHLVVEEKWRNQKRNYCGLEGQCDCGNEVPCLRRYQMEIQTDKPELCLTKADVEEVLKGAPKYHIAGSDKWANRDKKAQQRKQNRDKRKRSQDLHQHKTERKQGRLSRIDEEVAASSGSDGE